MWKNKPGRGANFIVRPRAQNCLATPLPTFVWLLHALVRRASSLPLILCLGFPCVVMSDPSAADTPPPAVHQTRFLRESVRWRTGRRTVVVLIQRFLSSTFSWFLYRRRLQEVSCYPTAQIIFGFRLNLICFNGITLLDISSSSVYEWVG